MANDFFVTTGYPSYQANGDSASARSEIGLIEAGFDKLPLLTGLGLRIVRVNAAGTALESVTKTTALIMSLDGTTTPTADLPMGTFKLTGLGAATTNGDAVRYEQVGALAAAQLAVDTIKASHIDWGTGADQVSASDVPNTPAGDIAATDVQTAINELDTEKFSLANNDAGDIINTPAGDIAAITVQAAIDELDTSKVQKTSDTGSAELPAGTTAQRDGAPVVGMVRWNSTLTRYEGWDGAAWSALGGGATGGSSDAVFHENDQTVTADYTITAGKNAVSAGAITINTGVTVTVPTGSRWVVV